MLAFVMRRLGTMVLTMLCLTMVVFFMVNLEPNLRKLSISQLDMRSSDEHIESWLVKNGYRENFFVRYGQWLGVWPKHPKIDPETGEASSRFSFCDEPAETRFSGVLQGDFGCSTKFKTTVAAKLFPALGATGILMFWVMVTMVPIALLIGVLAGMREGSRTDRTLSVASIATTATPEYVSGVIFTVIFASWLGWLNGSAAQRHRPGHHLLQFHAAGDDHGDLRHRLHRAHDPRLDGRGDDAAIYPHRAAQGTELLKRRHQARAAQRADRAVHRHHAAVSVAADRRRHRRGDVPLPGLRLHAGGGGRQQRHRPAAGLLAGLGRSSCWSRS